MFDFFKKKNKDKEELDPNDPRVKYPAPPGDPLKLPVIPEEMLTPQNISEHLKNNEAIWVWKPEAPEKKGFLASFSNSFKGFYVYQRKQKYLYKYEVYFRVMQGYEKISPFLKELAVWKLSDEVIEEWIQNDFQNAKVVHYDDADAIGKAQHFKLKLTDDDIKRYLHTHDRLDITDDDFWKRGEKEN
ncbi:hypothetical protein [Eubacterium sp. F2]|jgi:hypothetical protein|uniref:hypothetical protein n=1 Tax=Eubacterium sp. F2 TaxID=3381348 RepID=UPI00390837FD